jgi:uncharacterized protein YigA (DUF484 family)
LSIRPEEIAKYLKDHPEFFEEYGDLLSSIQVRHPHGKHAIPLSERQVLTLRERSRALEGKLRELVQFGEENDTISDRVHRLSVALMRARTLSEVIAAIQRGLREDFGVPAVALRLWPIGEMSALPEHDAVSEEMRVFADSLASPYFCERPMFESAAWFPVEPGEINSLVYLPLHAGHPLGVLTLASGDAARFTTEMGTLYVVRLGELISMALARCLED